MISFLKVAFIMSGSLTNSKSLVTEIKAIENNQQSNIINTNDVFDEGIQNIKSSFFPNDSDQVLASSKLSTKTTEKPVESKIGHFKLLSNNSELQTEQEELSSVNLNTNSSVENSKNSKDTVKNELSTLLSIIFGVIISSIGVFCCCQMYVINNNEYSIVDDEVINQILRSKLANDANQIEEGITIDEFDSSDTDIEGVPEINQ